MKLLYITNGISGSGGLERVLSIKTNALVDYYSYEIHIITLNESSKKAPFFFFNKAIVFHNITVKNRYLYFIDYIKKIKSTISLINPDIISVCDDGLKGFFIPQIINKKFPIIYERHASININLKPGLRSKLINNVVHFLMKKKAKEFSRFIVLSQHNISEWSLPNIMVIPNPLPQIPIKHAQLENKKVIAVGSQSYNKGYDRLLEIWKKVVATHQDWVLEIYGKQNNTLQLQLLANKLNICSSVFFFDPVKNIEEVYLSSSVLVLSSRSEGFGMVLLEAMSYGVPCISFDCPSGPRDIVDDGHTGFLIDDGDISAFAERLTTLMSLQKLRKKMGNAANMKAQFYSIERIALLWNELFVRLKK